jgi:hypothetical protein
MLANMLLTPEVTVMKCKKRMCIIIYVNTFLVIILLRYGIVYLTLLFLQSLLIPLRIVWTSSGLIRMFNSTGRPILSELEVVAYTIKVNV